MNDVQFQSDDQSEFGSPPSRSGTDLTGKLIKWGIVSSRQQAEYVMIGIGIVVLIITFFVYRSA